MIANPDDLVLGQDGSAHGSAATAGRAIRVYRERAADRHASRFRPTLNHGR